MADINTQKISSEVQREQNILSAAAQQQGMGNVGQTTTTGATARDSWASGSSSSSERPTADRNAFMTSNDGTINKSVWQSELSPAQRAKQLEQEMKEKEKVRKQSGAIQQKMVKIGEKVVPLQD